ncbi:MAG: hydrogen gas-evolving membrane-bound hydrogenase subunit E [Desulfobacteraceae bacterium]|jgi:multicomponent Na+:H+ antiporter subunit A|nr:hydrogen gas-evolving membrane-bound hydrogenase subunit E [Desulfobacteraceae bacterium]
MVAQKDRTSIAGRISSVIPLGLFVTLIYFLPRVAAGAVFRIQLNWIPSLGINLSIVIDGLSLLFGLIICCVGFFVSVYAADYLPGSSDRGRFFSYFHGFLLAMLGLVLADNMLSLFVFWELTTIISYLLIGFECESETARRSARQALLMTGSGGLALLIGFLLLGGITDTYDLSLLAAQSDKIKADPLYFAVLLMVFIGSFTKSAQFPFPFWLPNAMTAPTPISAFLHSATMVKAGIYLLARFHPILGGTAAWMGTLVIVGGVTALIGSVLAVKASDLKRILAFTTIMALGILTMFLGGKTTPALTAAMTFLMVHSLYKSSLFLAVGIIDHQTGTRQIDQLGGLFKPMPITALATIAAALSMAGFPLFFGFIGKEIMYKGALTEELFPVFATSAALLANSLMVAVAGLLTIKPFLGNLPAKLRRPHEAPMTMWLGPVFMGGLGPIFGIFPDWVGHWLIEPAVRAFHPSMEDIQLKLFYGINEPLLLSIATLSLGGILYRKRRPLRQFIGGVLSNIPFQFENVYTGGLEGIAKFAKFQTAMLQNGSLHRYLSVIIASVVIGVGLPFFSDYTPSALMPNSNSSLTDWLVIGIITVAVMVVVIARSRLLAICCLGIVGAGIAMLFLMHGAPDVALTQLLVETLTVIIVSLVLLRLPQLNACRPTSSPVKIWNGLLAVSIGTMITALILTVTQTYLDRSLTNFFEANSYLAAHGRNIVNVILVDFRSFDTLGEITVVALAGLAGYALIQKRKVN